MTTTYTTEGSVRGSCGHKHRTLQGAADCLKRDAAGCRSQGGYSDRSLYQIDGEETTRLVRTGYGDYDYEPLPAH